VEIHIIKIDIFLFGRIRIGDISETNQEEIKLMIGNIIHYIGEKMIGKMKI
jgi:hypothetical protein